MYCWGVVTRRCWVGIWRGQDTSLRCCTSSIVDCCSFLYLIYASLLLLSGFGRINMIVSFWFLCRLTISQIHFCWYSLWRSYAFQSQLLVVPRGSSICTSASAVDYCNGCSRIRTCSVKSTLVSALWKSLVTLICCESALLVAFPSEVHQRIVNPLYWPAR